MSTKAKGKRGMDELTSRIMFDLQGKLNDDIDFACRRVILLVDQPEAKVGLALQAACTGVHVLAQVLEQTAGRKPVEPLQSTVLTACLMAARAVIRDDIEISKLVHDALADADELATVVNRPGAKR